MNYYTITTGNQDVGRRPTQWKLEGSNDGTNWELLDAHSGGFILYIDDEENARYNLPLGPTTHLTQPVTEAEAATGIRISIDMSHISNQNNVLCVETHTISVPEENEFNVEVEFVNTSTDMVSDGTMSSSDPGYDDGYWHEGNDNIFNKNTNDKFNVMNDDAMIGTYHVWAAWTYKTTAV